MPAPGAVSVLLGYASIFCWLFAQVPQLLANYRNQSVEGLALPFLANWLFGDITNLVGCILTDQLDFQKYLATYFCIVDVCLVSQFFYYSDPFSRKPVAELPEAEIPVTRSPLVSSRIVSPQVRYRAIHHAAANIAAAAASAAYEYESQFEHPPRRSVSMSAVAARQKSGSRQPHGKGVSAGGVVVDATPQAKPSGLDDEDDEEADEVPAMMHDSFLSDDGRPRGFGAARRPPLNLTMSTASTASDAPSTGEQEGPPTMSPTTPRGRALTRQRNDPNLTFPGLRRVPLPLAEFDNEEVGLTLSQVQQHRRAASAISPSGWGRSRERGSVSRRSATIVFLGVWALFGLGGSWSSRTHLGDSSAGARSRPVWQGHVLGDVAISQPGHDPPAALPDTASPFGSSIVYPSPSFAPEDHPSNPPRRKPPKRPTLSNKLIIGRMSAWLCTTLYLTSRLPQIWKNFVRKSVEGLSMTLFVAAFLGNLFYVMSILTSPALHLPPDERYAYIRETMPYLLGSGGTLLFDVTIVTQSFIYRGRKPMRYRTGSVTTYGGSVHRRGQSIARHSVLGAAGEEDRLLASSTLSEAPGTIGKRSVSRRRYGTVG